LTTLPPALENGNPMVRRIRDEFHIGTRAPRQGRYRAATRSRVSGCRRLPCCSGRIPAGTSIGHSLASSANRDGPLIPFARTRTEREAAGDSHPSLEERYGSRENYISRVEAAAAALVARRLLLPADAAAYVKSAGKCDRF
jgi:hypothetical protein